MDSKKQYRSGYTFVTIMHDGKGNFSVTNSVLQQRPTSQSQVSASAPVLPQGGQGISKSLKQHSWNFNLDICDVCGCTGLDMIYNPSRGCFNQLTSFMNFDPNDLQSSPCCGGGIGSGSQPTYSNGKWHNADCNSLKPTMAQFEPNDFKYVAPEVKKNPCECGAMHTPNPNLHIHWCPEYKK